jgi:hypothetical protein
MVICLQRSIQRRGAGGSSNGAQYPRSFRPAGCIGRRNGICARSLSSAGLMLGAPLGARPAHVVQFWSIGVEQSVCEGTEQAARAAAVDEAGDIRFIHGRVLLSYLLSSRSQEPRFCLSAPNICLLQPKREQRRFEAIQTRLISLFQLRPRRPDVPALLKLRLGFL